ncbi:pyridoxal 5'-phosphate synthase glutaminase subunit PdxT [Kamptonema cortianum]|nr:pyridoxal 5'-phosphate synthase glutaminase subunit PdxT [Geitlerinema splendidum]MDK3162270.1 pyridoxal 5'-phosphate synthase glutaminase subunit PdxT [Kamptonema cortianum]
MAIPVGLLAIQGDFQKHGEAFVRAGLKPTDLKEVRSAEDLAQVERLVIPGGESTTVGLLLSRYGLGEAIQARAAEGMPIWGTCMGMILMAKEVEGRNQYTLDLLDITVLRNAFGAQVHSFEDQVAVCGLQEPVTGVFIRAPIVTRVGEGVQTLATYNGHTVAVRKGRLIGTSFHPELTEDSRLHSWFLTL